MLMPWGRYKGQEISSVPIGYLEWIRNNLALTGQLADEIDKALGREPNPNHIANCRAAIIETVEVLTDRQVMKLYGFTERLLCASRTK